MLTAQVVITEDGTMTDISKFSKEQVAQMKEVEATVVF
jgi:hypothetical protein